MRVNHIGLVNNSKEAARTFYHTILGLDEKYSFTLKEDETRQIFGMATACDVLVFEKDGVKIEVFVPGKKVELNLGMSHFCLDVKDLPEVLQRCEAKGAEIIRLKRGERVVHFVKDFCENIIELKEEMH